MNLFSCQIIKAKRASHGVDLTTDWPRSKECPFRPGQAVELRTTARGQSPSRLLCIMEIAPETASDTWRFIVHDPERDHLIWEGSYLHELPIYGAR